MPAMFFLLYLFFYSLICLLFTFWTDRNLDFWVSHLKGEEVDVPFWAAFLLTFFINGIALVGNIVAEIARFVL